MTNQYPYRFNTTQGTATEDDPRYETPGGAANKIEQALEDAKEYTDDELLSYVAQTVNLADDSVTRPKIAPGAVGATELDPSLLDYTTDIAVAAKFSEVDAQLAETLTGVANAVEGFQADITGVVDSTAMIQAAIDSIETPDYTEAIPAVGAQGTVYLPAGRYKISAKLVVPSYVRIIGAGRHNTFLDSYITNGDPVIEVINPTDNQQFYVNLESFTINGRRQNCQGIKIYKTSRWVIRDVIVNGTAHEGLYVYSGFIGEIYSLLVRACGDPTHYAVHLTGPSSISGGSHAVSFFGGEINGGTGTGGGLYAEYGNSITLNSTTVEGFANGAGITVKNANSFMVNGCYFELNKEDIVEIGNTLGTVYSNNIFATLAAGARGHIGLTYAQGSVISGNYFQDAGLLKIFDATGTGTGKLHMSAVFANYSTSFPISIESSILTSARASGTTIETYDTSSAAARYGNHKFIDIVEVVGDLRPTGGIRNIGGFTRSNILGNNGTPEGSLAADPGSLCLNGSDTTDRSTAIYLKASGVNSTTGWLAMQATHSGSTASRPTVSTVGYMYFDSTLGKPIWWNGSAWKDATGTTV